MARRKRRKTTIRRVTKTVTRNVAQKPESAAIAGAIYGAVRAPISDFVARANIPVLNQVGDEIVLAAIHYFGAKKIRNKNLKNIFRAGLTVEAAMFGAQLASSVSVGQSSNGQKNIVIGS